MKLVIYVGVLVFVCLLMLGRVGPSQAGIGDWDWHGIADLNDDCVVDIVDEQAIAFRYGSWWGTPYYDTKYDVDPFGRTGEYDYDIDVKDLQTVFGRDGFACIDWWDIETSMGMYSYKGSSSCSGSSNYKDPITVVFTGNATLLRVKQEAATHGFPVLEDDGEQRFWEIGACTYEDVDAAENNGGSFPDFWIERWHLRAERGPEGPTWDTGGHPAYVNYRRWGIFSVATPHFDDDDNFCGHFVPSDYPYCEPGFCPSGSGFDAGREYIYKRFVTDGGHSATLHWWGNRTPIRQSCGGNPWSMSNGWVYYVGIS